MKDVVDYTQQVRDEKVKKIKRKIKYALCVVAGMVIMAVFMITMIGLADAGQQLLGG